MSLQNNLLAAVAVPILGAFVLPLVGRGSPKLRNGLSLGLMLSAFVFSLKLVPAVLSGATIIVDLPLVTGSGCVFLADGLAVFMAVFSSFISSVIVLYSFGYISHYENQNEYYSMVVLFLGAMMGLVFS